MKLGLVARNVCALVSPPRKRRQEMKAFTAEQARQFLDAVAGHPHEAWL